MDTVLSFASIVVNLVCILLVNGMQYDLHAAICFTHVGGGCNLRLRPCVGLRVLLLLRAKQSPDPGQA